MSSRCRAELLGLLLLLPSCNLDLRKLDLGDLDLIEKDEPEPEPVEIQPDVDGKNPKLAVPGAAKGVVDLGVAVYPKGSGQKKAIAYTFNVPPNHKLAYSLDAAEAASIRTFYETFAKSVSYKRIGPKAFQWSPPANCPSDMSCVYKKLVTRTHDDVLVLAQKFKKRADAGKLNASQLAQMVLAYVQTIPYKIPDEPFGLKPPPLVVTDQYGDCDSKALLLYMLLNSLGIETVIMSSKAHKHSLAGIAVPTTGSTFRWKERKYAFAETTAKGAPLGFMPPDLASPNDWVVELAP